MSSTFISHLKANAWKEIWEDNEYRKKNWFIVRDTGAWWMVGTTTTPRVFDITEPNGNEGWMVNLLEHLSKCDDALKTKGKTI